ncbi:MAG: hypothetical protein AN487_19450 [Anabaena sp. CRKS33]|jgi:hypothetical protein|nr:MAG: hypothetical protein AN487_19450 [Anabaena sp. CRKS33]
MPKEFNFKNVNARNITIFDRISLPESINKLFKFIYRFFGTYENKNNILKQVLRQTVKTNWLNSLNSLLEDSGVVIELKFHENYDCDNNNNNDNNKKFATIADLYDISYNILLILGEPGSGKTTTLLRLAKNFVEQETSSQKLVAIFDLTYWSNNKLSFHDWLVDQLYQWYRIERQIGKDWIKNEEMLLFFDGLDELNENERSSCVVAINNFSREYGIHKIIVCSRREQYKQIDKRLMQSYSVLIKPLVNDQIEKIINEWEAKGKQLTNLRKLLNQNGNIVQTLAETPLILDVMIELEELPVINSSTLEDYCSILFDELIKVSFDRFYKKQRKKALDKGEKYEKEKEKYQQKDVVNWLTWLAKKMVNRTFIISEIQPSWLEQEEKELYQISKLLNGGLFLGVLFGISYGFLCHHYLLHLFPKTESTLFKGVALGLLQGIITGPIAGRIVELLKPESEDKLNETEIKIYGKKVLNGRQIFRSIRKNFYIGIGICLINFFATLGIMRFLLDFKLNESISLASIVGPFFGFIVAIALSASYPFTDSSDYSDKNSSSNPNQGIWDSFHQALSIAAISSIFVMMIYIIVIIFTHKLDTIMVILGLCFSVLNGFLVMCAHQSGQNCFLHLNLRIILEKKNHIPRNYSDFLENVAKNFGFLKPINGGYQFFHPMFQDHFKNRDITQ